LSAVQENKGFQVGAVAEEKAEKHSRSNGDVWMKNVILSLIYIFILFVVAMNAIDRVIRHHYYPTDTRIWLGMAFLTAFFGYWVLHFIEKRKK
jgi:hypothetical protein